MNLHFSLFFRLRSGAALALLLAIVALSRNLQAQTSGAWSVDAAGNWNVSGNWSGNTVATGADALADFSLLNITADRTVTVNAPFTVGSLKFADTTQSNTWTLASSGTNVLTLQTTTGLPSIDVAAGGTTIISARLGGNQGFNFTGGGILRLGAGTNNSFTGNVNLVTSGGTLQFTTGSLNSATSVVFQADASLTWQGNHANDISSKIKINDGVTATLNLGSGNVTFASALQTEAGGTGAITKNGGGTLTITAANSFMGLYRARQGRTVLAGGDNRLSTSGTIAVGQAAQSGILQLGDSTAASNQTTSSLTGTATSSVVGGNASVSTITVNNSAAVTYNGLLGGAGTNENNLALAKSGSAVLTLTNAGNTFTGGVTLNQGTINFVAGSLGTSGLITYAGTSSLQWQAHSTDLSSRIKINDAVIATVDTNGNNVTFATALQTGAGGTGGLTKGGTGMLTVTGANTYTGNTRINNGRVILTGGDNRLAVTTALQFGSAANSGVLQLGDATGASHQTVTGLSVAGNASSVSNAVVGGHSTVSTFTVNNTANVTWNQFLGGTGTNENNLALTKTGAGRLTLGGTNTFTGDINIQEGTLAITKITALGTGPKTVTINGMGGTAPTLRLDGTAGDLSLSSAFSLVTSNDSAASPAIFNAGGNNVIAGTLSLTSGGFGTGNTRIRVDAGTLTLNGAIAPTVTASGPLAVIFETATGTSGEANGVLADTGATALGVTKEGSGTWTLTQANSYSGATTVNGGRLNLTTAQTGGGALTLADGTTLGLTLAAAGQGLATSALSLNGTSSGTTLDIQLGSFPNPGAAIIQGGSFTATGTNTINIAGTGLSVGIFDLISYTGSIGGDGFSALSLGSTPARVTASLDNAAPGLVKLNVSAFDVPKWTGAVNNIWDINDGPDPTTGTGTVNWKEANSGTATRYLQTGSTVDSVLFDESANGAGDLTVELSTTLTPTTATVNNATRNYTFTGTGKLSGATSLVKEGSGTLTLVNTGGNDHTGTTTITAGTLVAGDGATPGAGQLGSGDIILNGTLALNRPSLDDITIANSISGGGTLKQQGGNTVTLSGNNSTFAGSILVEAGALRTGGANALGTAAGGVTVLTGAALELTGQTVADNVQLNGGTLRAFSSTANQVTNGITLNGGGVLDGLNSTTLLVSSSITGNGGLVKSGNGTAILSVDGNSYTGGTVINQGILQIGTTIATGAGSLGAGDIALNAAASNTATLNIRRSDTALNLANNIVTTAGTGTNAITIDNGAAGVVTFSGTNTFTGNVTVNSGTLKITNSSALGIGTKTVGIGGALRPSLVLDGTGGDISLASGTSFAISSDGTVNTPGGLVNLAGDNTVNGVVSLVNTGGGNVRVVSQAGTLTLAGTVNADGATGNKTLFLSGASNGTISGVIADGISSRVVTVTKDGTGTWSLLNNNPSR